MYNGKQQQKIISCREYRFKYGNDLIVKAIEISGQDTIRSQKNGTFFKRNNSEVVYIFEDPPKAAKIHSDKMLFMELFLTCGASYAHFDVVNDSIKNDWGSLEYIKGQMPENKYQNTSQLIGTKWDFPKSFTLNRDEVKLSLSFNSMNNLVVDASIRNRNRRLSGMYWQHGQTVFCIFSSEDDKLKGICTINKWDQTVMEAVLKSKNAFVYELQLSQDTLRIYGLNLLKKWKRGGAKKEGASGSCVGKNSVIL